MSELVEDENADERKLSRSIIGASFAVHNTLGYGFLEKVYERALSVELRKLGIPHVCQPQVKVLYKGSIVGDYQADLIVDDRLTVEIKSTDGIAPEHIAQCLNYLKATTIRRGLILNFGKSMVDVKRLVFG